MQDPLVVQYAQTETRLKRISFAPSIQMEKLLSIPTANTYPRLCLTIWVPKR